VEGMRPFLLLLRLFQSLIALIIVWK
jgi:hypothetical protein